MGLANARFYASGKFFWDEWAATLEDQVLKPVQDSVEMGLTLEELVSSWSRSLTIRIFLVMHLMIL